MRLEMHLSGERRRVPLRFSEGVAALAASFGEIRTVQIATDYEALENKPSIEGVPLIGDKSFPQLNLRSLNNTELEALLTI